MTSSCNYGNKSFKIRKKIVYKKNHIKDKKFDNRNFFSNNDTTTATTICYLYIFFLPFPSN